MQRVAIDSEQLSCCTFIVSGTLKSKFQQGLFNRLNHHRIQFMVGAHTVERFKVRLQIANNRRLQRLIFFKLLPVF